jgi:hypothetical protein
MFKRSGSQWLEALRLLNAKAVKMGQNSISLASIAI